MDASSRRRRSRLQMPAISLRPPGRGLVAGRATILAWAGDAASIRAIVRRGGALFRRTYWRQDAAHTLVNHCPPPPCPNRECQKLHAAGSRGGNLNGRRGEGHQILQWLSPFCARQQARMRFSFMLFSPRRVNRSADAAMGVGLAIAVDGKVIWDLARISCG